MNTGSTPNGLRPRRLALGGVGLMLTAIPLFWLDLPLASFCRAGETPGEIRTIVRLAEAFSHGYGALAILIGVAVVTRVGWRRMAPLFALTYVPGLIVNVLKVSISRRRPNANVDELPNSFAESFEGVFLFATRGTEGIDRAIQSFPSGHTSVAVGLAIALSLAFPRGRWFFAVMAALGAFQRIDVGAHYASDTAFAAGISFVFAGLLTRLRPVRPFAGITTTGAEQVAQAGDRQREEPTTESPQFSKSRPNNPSHAA